MKRSYWLQKRKTQKEKAAWKNAVQGVRDVLALHAGRPIIDDDDATDSRFSAPVVCSGRSDDSMKFMRWWEDGSSLPISPPNDPSERPIFYDYVCAVIYLNESYTAVL